VVSQAEYHPPRPSWPNQGWYGGGVTVHYDSAENAAPSVTPDPVPADDMVVKLSLAALGGAILGSLIVYRWLSRRVAVVRR